MCGCLIAHTHRAPSLICIFSLAAICLPCLMQLFDLLTQIALQIMLDNLQVMQLHVCPSVYLALHLVLWLGVCSALSALADRPAGCVLLFFGGVAHILLWAKTI